MYSMRAEALIPPPAANQNVAHQVTSLPLNQLQHRRLQAALRAWEELTESNGFYDRSRRGFAPLLAKPELMNERSTVIVCEAEDPLDYLIAYYGGGFGLYKDKSFVAQRMRDIPDRDAVLEMIAGYEEVIREKRPRAHRVSGRFGGVDVTYDRLILPTVGESGEVDRLITLSAELERQPEPA
jgi:hypothetical protein